MKTLLITGVDGFLGIRTKRYYSQLFQTIGLGHHELDITDRSAVIKTISEKKPDIVLHCAAISDTMYAEQYPKESESINVHGTLNIAEACHICGAKLVYMSSDQVYNGNIEDYALPEDIQLDPQNTYGKHKLLAEKLVSEYLPSAVGLRLTWLYDKPESTFKQNRNIFINLQNAILNNTPIHAASHEKRGITNVWEVIKRFNDCIHLPGGVYNFGSENLSNSYDTYIAAAKSIGIQQIDKIVIADKERFKDKIRNLSMDTSKIKSYQIVFPNTIDGFYMTYENRVK